jgi:DNA-binding XRE family transcriptional regulator
MTINHVKRLREKHGLTQQALAEKAITSQQQIQRIERGQLTRLDTAIRIAAALGKPVEAVFPAMKAALKKLTSGDPVKLLEDEKLKAEFDEAGIDPEPITWRFRFVLDTGLQREVEVSSKVKSKLWNQLQEPGQHFMVFDGFEERFAIKVRRLALWQFLFDPGLTVIEFEDGSKNQDAELQEPDPDMRIWLGNNKEPWPLFLEGDYVDIHDDAESGDEIQDLFDDFECCFSEDELFHVEDVDGESAFFRAEHIALITVKLAAVKPELNGDDEEET